jgi:glycosyltransferase involved in cell wall biosynthesis/SAM-dependent methyltransferase
MVEFTGERIVPGSKTCEPLFAQKMYQEHIARYLFAAQLAKGRNVLDMGCGVGYGARTLALRGAARVVAFDVAADAIEHARANYAHPAVDYRVADARRFEFEEKFGLVTCFELIEHVDHQAEVVRRAGQHLEDGGFLVISTPRSLGLARSAFHVRELTGYEFQALLATWFPYVAWFVENNHFSSLVTAGAPQKLDRIYCLHDQFAAGMSDYLVAVASRRPFDAGSISPQLVVNDDKYVLNLEKDVAVLHRSEKDLKARLAGVESQLQAAAQAVDPLREDVARLSRQLREMEETASSAERGRAQAVAAAGTLSAQLEAMRTELENAQVSTADLRRANARLLADLAAANEELEAQRARRRGSGEAETKGAGTPASASRLRRLQARLDAANWRVAALERGAGQRPDGQQPVVAGFDAQLLALSTLVSEQTLVIDDLMSRLNAILNSQSWRLTAPLRALLARLAGRPESAMARIPSIAHLERFRHLARSPQSAVPAPAGALAETVRPGALPWRAFYDLIYVIGCHEGESKRYRVSNYAAALSQLGYDVLTLLDREYTDLIQSEVQARALVLFRCAWDDRIAALVSFAKRRGIPVVFDVDDLVFEPESTHLVRVVNTFDEAAQADYRRGVERYRRTLEQSDFATCSTNYLAERIRQAGLTAHAIPNTLNLQQIERAEALRLSRAPAGARVRIGYFSGSNTHQVDFRACEDALLQVMARHPEVVFVLVGILDLDERWKDFSDRIERYPLLPHLEMLDVLAGIDINLAPLETGNPYCEAKSQLKIFEAGIVGVPTIASAVSSYAEAIASGADGFLAAAPQDWLEPLERLVSDSGLRARMGAAACERAMRQYSPAAGARAAEKVFGLTAPRPADAVAAPAAAPAETRKLRIAWIIPGLILGGGGHRNILRAAYHLERFGHTLDLYFTNYEHSAEQLVREVREHFYPLQCRMRKWADHIEPCDVLFATHWSTVELALRARHAAGEVMYFVQDFEPLFAPMGTEYVLAENTYRQGLYAITSGAWCERLLRKEFGMEADHFVFPIDREVYHPRPRTSSRRSVVFFAKPEMPRRCYDLGVWALREMHQRRPDVEIILFGSRNVNAQMLPFPATVKALLPTISDLAELYCNADLGIAFSTTNPSLVPYEMMACGLPVVDLDRPGNEFNYGGRTDIAFLFDPNPAVMGYQICDALARPDELARRSANGLEFIRTFPTEEEMARRIESLILARVGRGEAV